MDEGNIIDWNLSNFVSVGLIGATWLAGFALLRKIITNKRTVKASVPFSPALNQGVSLG